MTFKSLLISAAIAIFAVQTIVGMYLIDFLHCSLEADGTHLATDCCNDISQCSGLTTPDEPYVMCCDSPNCNTGDPFGSTTGECIISSMPFSC